MKNNIDKFGYKVYKINIKVKMGDKRKMKNKKLKKNIEGITLIALAVTIIVLLILAGVALNLTIGQNGIFSRAKDATNTWKKAEINEQLALDEGANLIDSYLNGNGTEEGDITKEKLKIGDYVEYTPDTVGAYSLTLAVSGYTSNQSIPQETMKWQIMSINEDGTIDLVSENATTQRIYLKGALGYNNGVYVINDICKKQYSNKNLNVTARNLNKDDIVIKMNSKGINAMNATSNEDSGTLYGKTRTYIKGSAATEYPNLYEYENGSGINSDTVKQDGIGLSDAYYSTPTNETLSTADKLTATQTYSWMQIQSAYFDDINFYNTIFKAQWSWLSTRFQNCAGNHVGFGLCAISDARLDGSNMYFAGQAFDDSASLRPVVTLGANVEFSNGDGSIDNPYKISI